VDSLFIYCHPGSIFRTPIWRWQRANHLVEHNQGPIIFVDDEWVNQARQFLLTQNDFIEPDSLRPSCERGRSILAAWRLYRNAESLKRIRLEAYLLTQLSLDQVSRKCQVSLPVVDAFGQVFFDVFTVREPYLTKWVPDWSVLL